VIENPRLPGQNGDFIGDFSLIEACSAIGGSR
jgi:hypothetical protein